MKSTSCKSIEVGGKQGDCALVEESGYWWKDAECWGCNTLCLKTSMKNYVISGDINN